MTKKEETELQHPHAYKHTPYAFQCTGPNPFQPDGAEQTDINYLVDRFLKTGEFPNTSYRQPIYQEYPQQDLNTVLTNFKQLQHDQELNGYGSLDPSQEALGASVTNEKKPTNGSVSSEPIVQPDQNMDESEVSTKIQSKKVPKG